MAYKPIAQGFTISACALNLNDNSLYDLSNSISTVMIKKSFIENIFPLYVLDLYVTKEIRDILRDNRIKVHLTISTYNLNDANNDQETDEKNIAETGIVFDDDIRIYSKPYTTTVSKTEETDDDVNTQDQSIPYLPYRICGIPEKLISKNESIMNNIYLDCEVADVLVNMISTIEKNGPVYIQETDNKEVYKDILVPPVSFSESIEFINKYYIIYNHGANLWIDNDGIYLYDAADNTIAKRNTIEYKILSSDSTNGTSENAIPKIDENNNLKLEYRSIPPFLVIDDISDHQLGSHSIVYFYDENFELSSYSVDNDNAYTKERYIWNILTSPIDKGNYKNISTGLLLTNLDPSLISPLTSIKIVSEDYPKLQGEYDISSVDYIFSSNDRQHYSNTITISGLKK